MLKPIQISGFALLFNIVVTFAKAQMDAEDMRLQNQFNSDVRHDLADSDLKLALSDLTLKDLKSLQAFIDSVDYSDLDYQDNSFSNEKFDSYGFDQDEFDSSYNNAEDGDDSFGSRDIQNNLGNYLEHQVTLQPFAQENQRAKRDDQTLHSNDFYIKQLVQSFPQNDFERKASHIRVKRN